MALRTWSLPMGALRASEHEVTGSCLRKVTSHESELGVGQLGGPGPGQEQGDDQGRGTEGARLWL
jgi:hypothetical protein